jgi:hypothetical protein
MDASNVQANPIRKHRIYLLKSKNQAKFLQVNSSPVRNIGTIFYAAFGIADLDEV